MVHFSGNAKADRKRMSAKAKKANKNVITGVVVKSSPKTSQKNKTKKSKPSPKGGKINLSGKILK